MADNRYFIIMVDQYVNIRVYNMTDKMLCKTYLRGYTEPV